jgi:hypothetical protein
MPLAGETIVAGKIPGERIATTPFTSDSSSTSGTTELSVGTVVAPVVAGRVYRVRYAGEFSGSVANDDVTVKIREDLVSGTILNRNQIDNPVTNVFPYLVLEAEYTADATEDKTFHLTLVRTTGTGVFQRRAAADKPGYLYVDYIRES